MTIKSAGSKSLIILVMVLALCICGTVYAAGPKDNAKNEVKLPAFKNSEGIKFDQDDQKFFVWLNEFYPEDAAILKDFENNPTKYHEKFVNTKSSWRRLWNGYKENKDLGKALVVEVRLRRERNRILGMYNARVVKSTSDKEYKAIKLKELTKVVSKEFDIAMQIKRIRYQSISTRINHMKKGLTRRQEEVKQLIEHKDAEVKKRVDELLKGSENIDWRYPKNKGIAPKSNPSIKLPVLKDIKFTEDDQKFFVWLNKFFPNYAQDIKDQEKKPQEYRGEFNKNKSMFRRLWRGYKFNKQYGKTLVEEVKLRVQRLNILEKLKAAKDQKQKAKFRNDLGKIVSKEFDVAVKVKKQKYEGLKRIIARKEKELAKRENEVKKLVANKAREVKKRVEDLITGEEKINWK